jgi:hypothetical protein
MPGVNDFIHRENLAIFEKRLAEPHSAAQHKILIRLLAEERAKGGGADAKNG